MPTYEYECKSCGHVFEAIQSMIEAPLKECPECGREIRRLIHGGGGVIFKGSGFYVTDKSSGAKTGSSKAENVKTEAKPDAGSACASCSKAEAGSCPAAAAK
ncbi:MAG: zinc ribbon domain-containing protein [Treponema sp.]|nr:zinc ribbon domain-containing protein [Treponema sp.]